MNILTNNEINREIWNSFLMENKFASPFQSFEFFNFINSVPGQSARAFAVELNNKLQALCVVTFQKERGLKGYFSRRAIIYGGPLLVESADGDIALDLLLNNIHRHLIQKVIYGEIRNLFDYSKYEHCFLKNKWQYESHLNVQILIRNKSSDEILKGMKYQRRREIALSIKAGATIKQANTINDIRQLYTILRNLYNKRVKSPLPEFEFFHRLFLSEVGKIFLVEHDNHIIGGSFCVQYTGMSVNTLYYCGLRNYHRHVFPTALAVMAAIDFGLKNNLQTVDLMGAGKPDKEYGVRTYKTEFGGELVEHGRYVKMCNPFLYHLGAMGLEVLNKIKK